MALLLILGCGALAGAAVIGQDDSVGVVVAARDLPSGTVIAAEDLRGATLSGGEGVSAIAASDAASLLGETTQGVIPAGTLLNRKMVAGTDRPGPGQVAVGLALVPGQLPDGQLEAGRLVALYQLPAKDGEAAAAGGPARTLVERAEVLSVNVNPNGGTLVNVAVAADVAPAVTAASSAGVIGVGLLPLGTR